MKSKFAQALVAGLIATAVMTGFMFLAPMMGLPKMNPATMLSGMLGVSLVVGYLMHFMIGIIFACVYVYLFNPNVHISSKVGKGIVFGIAVFVFAVIMMFLMSKLMPMPPAMMQGDMMLMVLGALIGHMVYGIIVALVVPNYVAGYVSNPIKHAHA